MGRALGTQNAHCPVTTSVSDRLVRLPFYTELSRDDQSAVIEAVLDFSA
jgi:dTDP-4-amino-4,6-dideoxygalactose transaminase